MTEVRPMFPLGSVLFPHLPLPLRLFEPRYLQMLGNLLEEPEPAFGVVLIERGHEVGGGDHRFSTGTLARIVQVESGADAMGVMAVGTDRFEVSAWLPDAPYPQAQIEPIAPLEWDDDLGPLRAEVEEVVRRALSMSRDAVWPHDIEVAEDPMVASWQLAAITPAGPLDQLSLLRSGDTAELLHNTRALAEQACEIADW